MKLSTPRVIASASPRKREKDPKVTISGGSFSRVIKAAFSPPAAAPITRVQRAASHGGNPASRQSFPKEIAQSPRSEPTDRSMPPVRMIGVITRASKPSSTLKRIISSALPVVAKFSAVCEKMKISARSTAMSSVSKRRRDAFQSGPE